MNPNRFQELWDEASRSLAIKHSANLLAYGVAKVPTERDVIAEMERLRLDRLPRGPRLRTQRYAVLP